MGDFRKELEQIINKHSYENMSGTPDFILAHYLHDCLTAFDSAVIRREAWYTQHLKKEINTAPLKGKKLNR